MRAETAPRMTPTPRTTLHVARSTRVVGKRNVQKSYYGEKILPTYPRTVLGLAQQRVMLMCGPGPGAPVGVQK